jgi:hypothetical protein
MPTLGTQTISSSYPQLIKTFSTGGIDGSLQVITDGDDTSSALSLSTTGVKSTGSFAVDGASTLTGLVTFGTSLTASTGTATIGTLSVGTQSVGTSSVNTSTIGTLNVSGLATVGSLEIGGTAGPLITKVSYGTAAFTAATATQYNGASTTTGTFALTGCALGDIVYGSIDSLGTATGTYNIGLSFYPQATNVVRYAITNQGSTAGTIPAGIIYATAMRFTA